MNLWESAMKQTESDARRGFWNRMSDQERAAFIERRKQAAAKSRYRDTPKGHNVNLAKGRPNESR